MALELPAAARHTPIMARIILILLLILGLAPGTWWRTPRSLPNHDQRVMLAPLPLADDCCRLGPFRLAGAWRLTSPNDDFGGYSALLLAANGRLLALSDKGFALDFAKPGMAGGPARQWLLMGDAQARKQNRDIESATRDPASGRFWIALEGRNAIARFTPAMALEALRQPPEMHGWPQNTGPEAMVRLADGRFIVLSESYAGWGDASGHPALLFASDPAVPQRAVRFGFAGAAGYRPTDMAQLPDGRVLVLMRRLVWPMPARFAGKILLADPADIRAGRVWGATELADLSRPLPVDNFEALAIEPAAGGHVAIWLMSDNNDAATQQTLLWRLDLDPADLPAKQKARR